MEKISFYGMTEEQMKRFADMVAKRIMELQSESDPFSDYPDYLTINQAAEILNISPPTLYERIKDPYSNLNPLRNGRNIRLLKSEVIQYWKDKRFEK